MITLTIQLWENDLDIFLFKVSIVNNHFNIYESLLPLTDGRGQMNIENKSIVLNYEHSLIGSFRRWVSNDPVSELTEDTRKLILISTSCSRDIFWYSSLLFLTLVYTYIYIYICVCACVRLKVIYESKQRYTYTSR